MHKAASLLHQVPAIPPCSSSLANKRQFRGGFKPGLVSRSKNMSSEQQASTAPGPCKTDVDLEQEGFFQKWRANVGLCVVNSQGLVFAAQRTDTAKHTWQMPQGKLGVCVLIWVSTVVCKYMCRVTGIGVCSMQANARECSL
eukprot:scaffold74176_cov20-Tisochrysis_lutea.AAC.5